MLSVNRSLLVHALQTFPCYYCVTHFGCPGYIRWGNSRHFTAFVLVCKWKLHYNSIMNINEPEISISAVLGNFIFNLITLLKLILLRSKYWEIPLECVSKLAHLSMHSTSNIEFIIFFHFYSPGLLTIGTSH